MTAAIGRQLKQSVKVFHNLILYRRLPSGARGKKMTTFLAYSDWIGDLEQLKSVTNIVVLTLSKNGGCDWHLANTKFGQIFIQKRKDLVSRELVQHIYLQTVCDTILSLA